MPKPEKKLMLKELQRRLKLNKKLTHFNYRGERTFVVISGMNSEKFNLSQVKGLDWYEERMLFFLFLLKYKRTKIVYVTSKNFNVALFDYYLGLVSSSPKRIEEMKRRLIHIKTEAKGLSLAERLLHDESCIRKISDSIENKKTCVLRCYYPTGDERKLAVALQVPLFGSDEKFDFVGTKSGSRKVFQLSKMNTIPGYSYIPTFSELTLKVARLMKDYPSYNKLVIKLDQGSSGRGNAIFDVRNFLTTNDVEISVKTDLEKLAQLIRKKIGNFITFQLENQSTDKYFKEFNRIGGIVELYIPGEIKTSPSVQISINPEREPEILSTHEQILGGNEKQKFLGCAFPCDDVYRKEIIKEAKKAAVWMAKKGMMGHFSIDFVVTKGKTGIYKIYPIEINLRKGGTTHPYRIAFYLTSAKYNSKKGMLYCGKTPIYYYSRDIIESENFKKLTPKDLIGIVQNSKISFNKNTKRGVLIFMPGTVNEYGRFGAISIGQTREEAELYFKKMIKLINQKLKKIS